MVRAFRGAITAESNTEAEILEKTGILYDEIIRKNSLCTNDFVCIFFSLTPELDKVFPARAVREKGICDVPLMCFAEIPVEGALKNCIRIMILSESDKSRAEIKHIYMGGATALRPDIAGKED